MWPLNPDGELINWTIIESKEGLAQDPRDRGGQRHRCAVARRRHAARRVHHDQRRRRARVRRKGLGRRDSEVLAACKEFNVAVRLSRQIANDIEMRMKQGFSVFVMDWGEAGFKAIEIGRKAANRPLTNQ